MKCCIVVADFFPIAADEMFAVKDKSVLNLNLTLPAFVEPPRVAATIAVAHQAKIEMLDAKASAGPASISFTIKMQLPQSAPYVGLLVDCENEQLQTQVQGVAMHTAQVRPTWPPSRSLLRALISVGMVGMHAQYPEMGMETVEPFISRALEVDAGLGLLDVPGILYAALIHGQLRSEGAST